MLGFKYANPLTQNNSKMQKQEGCTVSLIVLLSTLIRPITVFNETGP